MTKIFYVLLFLCISGVGVLWWLFNSLPPEERVAVVPAPGLTIEEDESSAEVPKDSEPKLENAVPPPVEAEASANASTEQSSETTKGKQSKSTLFVESLPPNALVYVDGVLKGKAPFSFDLAAADKVVRFELEGYEKSERTLESHHKEAGALTRWKVEMKKMSNVAKEAAFQKTDYRLVGQRGPYFVQLRSVAASENSGWLIVVQNYRDKMKEDGVFACDVDLGSKGRWTRFLVGPFTGKGLANDALIKARKLTGERDAFVTGDQECRD